MSIRNDLLEEILAATTGGGGDDPTFTTLTEGQVAKADASGKLIYGGATVDPTTEEWTFDKSINVPQASVKISDVIAISEATISVMIRDNVLNTNAFGVSTIIDDTGSSPLSYFSAGEKSTVEAQPDFSVEDNSNPLTAALLATLSNQTDAVTIKTGAAMTNVRMTITDDVSGVIVKYIPNKLAVDTGVGGLDFRLGDNRVDFNSDATDDPGNGLFYIGFTPLRQLAGQASTFRVEADNVSILGNAGGIPYLKNEIQFLTLRSIHEDGTTIEFEDGSTQSTGVMPTMVDGNVQALQELQTLNVSAVDTSPNGIYWRDDGLKMFILGAINDEVFSFDASIAWDVQSLTADTSVALVGIPFGRGLWFRPDGKKMYVLDSSLDNLIQYDLTTGWDLDTATKEKTELLTDTIAAIDQPLEIQFNANGRSFIITAAGNADTLFQFDVPVAYDIGSPTDSGKLFAVTGETTVLGGSCISANGSILWIIANSPDNRIFQYLLTTPWDVSTAELTSNFETGHPTMRGMHVSPFNHKLYISEFGPPSIIYEYNMGITPSVIAFGEDVQMFFDGTSLTLDYSKVDETGTLDMFGAGMKVESFGGTSELKTSLATDETPVLRLNQSGTNPGDVAFFAGDREPFANVSGNPGDFYILDSLGGSGLYQNTGITTPNTTGWDRFVNLSDTTDFVSTDDTLTATFLVCGTGAKGIERASTDGVSGAKFDPSSDSLTVRSTENGSSGYLVQSFAGTLEWAITYNDMNDSSIMSFTSSDNQINVTGGPLAITTTENSATMNGFEISLVPAAVIEIFSTADLDALASGGVITVSSTLTLIIKNPSLVSSNRFVLEAGSRLLVQTQGAGSSYTYLGTGTLFSGSGTLIIEQWGLNSVGVGGNLINVVNGSTDFVRFEDLVLFGFDDLGSITGGFTVFQNGASIVTWGDSLDIIDSLFFTATQVQEILGQANKPVFNVTAPSQIGGKIQADKCSLTTGATTSLFRIDPAIEATTAVLVERTTSTAGDVFDTTGNTGTFTAVANTSISAETINSISDDGGGLVQFNHSAVEGEVFVGEVITISGYILNTDYNGVFTVINAGAGFGVINVPFFTDEAGGAYASDAVTITDTATTLANGDTITLNTDGSTDYDGGATVFDKQTNSFEVNRVFTATATGSWSQAGLNQKDPRVLAFNNVGTPNSRTLAFGRMNANANTTSITDGTYTTVNLTTLDTNGLTQRIKLIDGVLGIFEITSDQLVDGFMAVNMWHLKSGSDQNYRLAFSLNGAVPVFASAAYAPMGVTTLKSETSISFPLEGLVKGDQIQVFVAGDGTANDLTFTDAVFNITGL